MIRSFRCRDTEQLANGYRVPRFVSFEFADGDAYDVEIVDYH